MLLTSSVVTGKPMTTEWLTSLGKLCHNAYGFVFLNLFICSTNLMLYILINLVKLEKKMFCYLVSKNFIFTYSTLFYIN